MSSGCVFVREFIRLQFRAIIIRLFIGARSNRNAQKHTSRSDYSGVAWGRCVDSGLNTHV